jgi:hypothetical protein
MKKHAVFLGLSLAATAASSCAEILAPLAIAAIYSEGNGPMRPSAAAIDPRLYVRGRWHEVVRLPRTSVVDVLTMDGTQHIGLLAGADDRTVTVLSIGIKEPIPRGDVLRLDLLYGPGPEAGAIVKQAAAAAAAEAAAATLVAAVLAGQAVAPAGVLRRAAAIGGEATGPTALAAQRGRLIYAAESRAPE